MMHNNESSIAVPAKKTEALRTAIAVVGSATLALVLIFFLGWKSATWQLYVLTIPILTVIVVGVIGLRFINNGYVERGTWIILIGMMATQPFVVFLISGFGLLLGLVLIISLYVHASQVLSTKDVRKVLVASMVIGLLIAATDLLHLPYRLEVPELRLFLPVVTVLSLLMIGFFIARQAWERSLRNKLIVTFMGVTLGTAAVLTLYLYTTTVNTLRQGLQNELKQHVDGVASKVSGLFDQQIAALTSLSLSDTLQQAADKANTSYLGDTNAIQKIMSDRDAEWQAADAANNNNDPLVQRYIYNPLSQELIDFQKAFPNHAEILVTDKYGGLLAATDRTSDYYQANEAWWQIAYNNGKGALYISEPAYDQSAGTFGIQIALPIYYRGTSAIVGVMRTTYQTSALSAILGEQIGETGETELYIPGRPAYVVHHRQLDPVDPNHLNALQAIAGQGLVEMDYENDSASSNSPTHSTNTPSVVIQTSMKDIGENTEFNKLGWIVVFHQARSEAYAPITSGIRGVVVVLIVVLLLAVVGAYFLSQILVRPITALTQAAERIANGDLNSHAEVTSKDETGILASTFNTMTSQLRETLQGLEQRVAARTQDLATVAEVGTATATILESKRLLQTVVDLTKERFNLYHSHIYLLDEKGENLTLTAGAGEPGRIMVAEGRSIPLDREQSLVARAARERKGVTVNDVTQAPDFLPNPLLPDTRSELAVPMIVGGKLIGVFDIQSDQIGRFTDSDINIQTTLAAQLATSIQNVRAFEQSKKQADLEALVNSIGERIQRSTSIEETLQTAIRELGTALGASRVRASISARNRSSN